MVPPDPMLNSEVKRRYADGSVGSPHVRVGHRQGFIKRRRNRKRRLAVFLFLEKRRAGRADKRKSVEY